MKAWDGCGHSWGMRRCVLATSLVMLACGDGARSSRGGSAGAGGSSFDGGAAGAQTGGGVNTGEPVACAPWTMPPIALGDLQGVVPLAWIPMIP